MGLHLNYELLLPSPAPAHETTALLTRLRTFALTQPLARVSELYDARANGNAPVGDSRGEGVHG